MNAETSDSTPVRLATAALVGGAVGIGGLTAIVEVVPSHPSVTYIESSQSHSSPTDNTCPPPSATSVHTVENLLTEQGNGDKIYKGLYRAHQTEVDGVKVITRGELTFVNPEFSTAKKRSGFKDGREALSYSAGYLNRLGVSLVVDGGANKPTAAQLSAPLVVNEMISIDSAFSRLPKEFYRAAGLKTVTLYAAPVDKKTRIINVGEATPGNVTLDIAHGFDVSNAVYHELGHVADFTECAGKSNLDDPAYTALNGGDIYSAKAGGKQGSHLAESTYQKTFYKALDAAESHSSNSDGLSCTKAHDIRENFAPEAQKVVVDSDYSLANVSEDKAELNKVLLQSDDYQEIFRNGSPRLEGKATILLARLYQLSPRSVKFLIADTAFRNTNEC